MDGVLSWMSLAQFEDGHDEEVVLLGLYQRDFVLCIDHKDRPMSGAFARVHREDGGEHDFEDIRGHCRQMIEDALELRETIA